MHRRCAKQRDVVPSAMARYRAQLSREICSRTMLVAAAIVAGMLVCCQSDRRTARLGNSAADAPDALDAAWKPRAPRPRAGAAGQGGVILGNGADPPALDAGFGWDTHVAGRDAGLGAPAASSALVDAAAARQQDSALTQPPTGEADASLAAGSALDAAIVPDSCNREALRERANAYLDAMAAGSVEALDLHPSVRYTENGREQELGLGLWLGRPQTTFARHALDEQRCSSLTEAVLTVSLAKIVLGLRLRHIDGQLLEIEAHVVPRNAAYYAPDAIIPSGVDPWIQPVAPSGRSSEEALRQVAAGFVGSITDRTLRPSSAAACKLRQNGADVGNGTCDVDLGTERFQQVRYPVVDVTAGIATVITRRRGYIAMMLFKVLGGTIQNIEIVGGASSDTTGW